MHQHGIMKDIKYEYNGRKMSVETLDVPLATFGKPTGFPTPFEKLDLNVYINNIGMIMLIGRSFFHVYE